MGRRCQRERLRVRSQRVSRLDHQAVSNSLTQTSQARFQAILKKQGFKIEKNGKIIALDGSAAAATGPAPAKPKTPKKTSKEAAPAAVKEEDETDEDGAEDDAEEA